MSLSAAPAPASPNFVPERDRPDLSGQVFNPFPISRLLKRSPILQTILITGGNSGIGYQIAKELLFKGATVHIAARSPDKAVEAIAELERRGRQCSLS
jgi:hypothetical protein